MRRHLIELVLFSTYAELRAERARSYLGLIWWILEPAMQMGAYWLVFGVIFKAGGPDYLPMLLIGLTLWQWMKSCITHGGYAIWMNLPLIRQVELPPLVFPLVQMLADTIKFLCIFALLLAILWCLGYAPSTAYFALPLVFAAVFLVAAGAGFVVASVVPLLPDLRFVIEQVLFVVMFLSGVVFSLKSVPSPIREIMELNPIAVLMEDARGILMRGEWPNTVGLVKVYAISIAASVIGIAVVSCLAPRYPKLAT